MIPISSSEPDRASEPGSSPIIPLQGLDDLHAEFRYLLLVLLLVTSIRYDGHATLPKDSNSGFKLSERASCKGVMDAVTTILPCKYEIVAATSYNNGLPDLTVVESNKAQTVSKDQITTTSCDNKPSHATAAMEVVKAENDKYDNYDKDRTMSKEQITTQNGLRIAAMANPGMRKDKNEGEGEGDGTDISVELANSKDNTWDQICKLKDPEDPKNVENAKKVSDADGVDDTLAWRIYRIVKKRWAFLF